MLRFLAPRRESCALVHLGIEDTLRRPVYRGTLSVNHFIHQTDLTSLTVSAHVHPQGFYNTNLLNLSGELEYQNRHVQDLSCLVIIHRPKPSSALSILLFFPEIFTLPPLACIESPCSSKRRLIPLKYSKLWIRLSDSPAATSLETRYRYPPCIRVKTSLSGRQTDSQPWP